MFATITDARLKRMQSLPQAERLQAEAALQVIREEKDMDDADFLEHVDTFLRLTDAPKPKTYEVRRGDGTTVRCTVPE